MEDKYGQLKFKIEKQVKDLAENIEKFCVLDNVDYTKEYKRELQKLHDFLEDVML